MTYQLRLDLIPDLKKFLHCLPTLLFTLQIKFQLSNHHLFFIEIPPNLN